MLSGRSFPGRVLLSRNTDNTIKSSRVTNPASTSDRSDGDNDPPSDFSDVGGYVKVPFIMFEFILVKISLDFPMIEFSNVVQS